jgi:hypothetical protein
MTWRNFHRIWFIRRLLPLSKVITRDIMTSIGWLEDGGTRPLGNGYRHPLRISGIDPFLRQPLGIRRCLDGQRRRRGDGIRLRIGIEKMR